MIDAIKFKQTAPVMSQMAIVSILKTHQYYFEPVNDFCNYYFYLVVKVARETLFTRVFHKTPSFNETYLAIDVCGGDFCDVRRRMVFTRDDIQKILSDVPENYIGEAEL